ncbi:hypothetical protein SORBI_3001G503801 [Sorghum bicolor]|uniref:Peptidase S26 domain-containing protein n=1 Tax=Sorghum bicolor TaxID=4558 RepID=A0A1Z5SBB7_SORBI|nr:hypothetical protein SORBI_3001G503801 [Sorghum bicolor]
MGTYNHLWSIAKRNAMAVVIGISISDRYVAFTSVTGESMYPTFTASSSVWGGDFVLAEKRCIEQYKFSHGDVILFNFRLKMKLIRHNWTTGVKRNYDSQDNLYHNTQAH